MQVGVEGLQMADLLSYVFIPISIVMGVEWADCRQVSALYNFRCDYAFL